MEKNIKNGDEIYRAVNWIWSFNFTAAEKHFTDGAESPIQCYYYGETLALRALLTEDPDDTKEAIKRLELAEKLLSKTQNSFGIMDVFRKLSLGDNRKQEDQIAMETRLLHAALLAELNALLGCLLFRRGHYVKGGLYIRKSWKAFEYLAKKTGVLRDNDESIDDKGPEMTEEVRSLIAHRNSILHFGVGAFYYFVSLVPSSFAWLVEALGFKANRKFGLNLLTKCYEMQGPRAMIALLLVLWIEIFFFEDKVKASEVLDLALQRYPEGTAYYYLGGYFARKQRDIKRAITYFEKVNELTMDVRRFQITSYYEIGWCHWLGADWREAASWFEKFLAEHKSPSFKAYCGYQLGIAYDMLGEKDKAVKAFTPVPGWVRKHYTWDQFAARKAKEYLKNNGMTLYERLIVHAQIIAKLHPDEALVLLKQARNTGEPNEELKAVYYYIKGLAQTGLQQFEKAKKSFERGILLERVAKREIYAIPHCLTEYGEILLQEGKVDEAKKAFTKARKGFSNYDFDKPLIRKLEKNLDQIKQRQKKEKREAKQSKATKETSHEDDHKALRRVKSYSGTLEESESDILGKINQEDIDDVKY